jgi:hypothetical protein
MYNNISEQIKAKVNTKITELKTGTKFKENGRKRSENPPAK